MYAENVRAVLPFKDEVRYAFAKRNRHRADARAQRPQRWSQHGRSPVVEPIFRRFCPWSALTAVLHNIEPTMTQPCRHRHGCAHERWRLEALLPAAVQSGALRTSASAGLRRAALTRRAPTGRPASAVRTHSLPRRSPKPLPLWCATALAAQPRGRLHRDWRRVRPPKPVPPSPASPPKPVQTLSSCCALSHVRIPPARTTALSVTQLVCVRAHFRPPALDCAVALLRVAGAPTAAQRESTLTAASRFSRRCLVSEHRKTSSVARKGLLHSVAQDLAIRTSLQ